MVHFGTGGLRWADFVKEETRTFWKQEMGVEWEECGWHALKLGVKNLCGRQKELRHVILWRPFKVCGSESVVWVLLASVDIISCKPPTFTGGGTRHSISHQSDIHHAAIIAVHMHNILTLDNRMQTRACYGWLAGYNNLETVESPAIRWEPVD